MLKQLDIENFTVFTKDSFECAAGLNVIVGENGTGKSHVLKLAYAVISASNNQYKEFIGQEFPSERLKYQTGNKLQSIFRTTIDKLKRQETNQGESSDSWVAKLAFNHPDLDFSVKDPVTSDNRVDMDLKPKQLIESKAVFFPTRELLSIYPGFVSLYEGRYLEFDETYRDTCLLLGEPLLKKPMTDLILILEEAMGGKVELDNGRFYLVTQGQGRLEMPLVAEGLRKLAMLAQLIAVGALEKGGYLFWDEPEANLNPRLIKVVAKVIQQLAQAGIQIFIATHSLFLLRELEILQSTTNQPVPQRYFALRQGDNSVEVEQGDTVDDLQTLVLLDEELQQSDRYMEMD